MSRTARARTYHGVLRVRLLVKEIAQLGHLIVVVVEELSGFARLFLVVFFILVIIAVGVPGVARSRIRLIIEQVGCVPTLRLRCLLLASATFRMNVHLVFGAGARLVLALRARAVVIAPGRQLLGELPRLIPLARATTVVLGRARSVVVALSRTKMVWYMDLPVLARIYKNTSEHSSTPVDFSSTIRWSKPRNA